MSTPPPAPATHLLLERAKKLFSELEALLTAAQGTGAEQRRGWQRVPSDQAASKRKTPKAKTKSKPKTRAQMQCRRCQQLGHDQRACTADSPACAVCAGAHHSAVCIELLREGKKPARKCVLCGGEGHSSPSYHCPARRPKKQTEPNPPEPVLPAPEPAPEPAEAPAPPPKPKPTMQSQGMQTEPLYRNVTTQTMLPVACDTIYDVTMYDRSEYDLSAEEYLMKGKHCRNSAARLAQNRAQIYSKCVRGDKLKPSPYEIFDDDFEFDTDFQHEVYWMEPTAISDPEPPIIVEPYQEPEDEPEEGDTPEPEETPETVPEPAEPMEPEPAPLPTTPPTPKPSNRAASRDNGPRTTKSAKNNRKRERGISVMTDAHLRAQPSVTTVVLDD